MYFSRIESSAVTIDDPNNHCVIINPELYGRVHNNKNENARVFWMLPY